MAVPFCPWSALTTRTGEGFVVGFEKKFPRPKKRGNTRRGTTNARMRVLLSLLKSRNSFFMTSQATLIRDNCLPLYQVYEHLLQVLGL